MAGKSDPQKQFLRYALATLAYRGGKTLRNAPPKFSTSRAGKGCRSAIEIVAHIGDLMAWAISMAEGSEVWIDQKPRSFDAEVDRFFDSMRRFDRILASKSKLACDAHRLLQGPIADALTHVGQLATLRRLAGSPIRGENYFVADITIGRVGKSQAKGRKEFD